MMREALIGAFGEGGRIATAIAPGRVNLIGEHTDYNGGYVLPMAIEFGIELAGRVRGDREVRFFSADYDQTVTFSLDEPLVYDREHPWSNYGRGVLWAMQQSGIELKGVDLAFGGDLPQGAGLSSSAALEVATAVVLRELFGLTLQSIPLALLCQRAESDFVGLRCGVMDQVVSLLGKRAHALFLDCRSLEYEQVPLVLGDHAIVICHSGVKHELVASEYNRRRQECEEGVRVLSSRFPSIRALRDADLEQLEFCRAELAPAVHRRCRHVISENQRVLESTNALRRGDLRQFGRLLNLSHDSLRDDFQVSCPEVDLLVSLAQRLQGVLGARITGGGFGGCTVNLVSKGAVEEFGRAVSREYQRQIGIEPRLFVSSPADGARILQCES